jgi:hypothetical protein
MRKAIITIAAFSALFAVFSPNVTNAEQADRTCFVTDQTGQPVAVTDTWVYVEKGTPNAGTAAVSILPCLPTVCPDGWWMASGYICSTVEPWAASPARDHSPAALARQAAVAVVQAAIVGPDVGPLIPFAPIGHKATT